MQDFHISDVLSLTTGRLVSTRHMDGVCALLEFLTGDTLFTHQLPRAAKECEPWLQAQFPLLMKNSQGMAEREAVLDLALKLAGKDPDRLSAVCNEWWMKIQQDLGLPEMLPVCALGEGMHLHIDPVEELNLMTGDKNVIAINFNSATE